VYDGSTQAIVLDMVDLLPAVVAERAAAEADPPPAIVVLGADDSVPARLAAATAGADAYVWRRTSPRRVVSFVSRIVRQRARDAADVVVLSPGAPSDRAWRLGGGDRHVRSVRVVPDLGMLAVHVAADVPDVVVLDDGVSADDVRAVGRLLRGNPAWHFTPIVAVVPVTDVASRVHAFEAGADDVVRADVAPAELAERLAVAASRARRGRVAAELDPLTHIPNRDRAEAAIEHLLRRAEVNGTRATIALIDVDRLADVNARYGEAAGDLVLHEFGALLTQFFRDDDTVGRWGTDEFVVGLAGVGTETASERLRALFERFEHQMGLGEHVEGITFSAGVATYPDDGRRSTRLLSAAATRMRTAQARGDQIVGAGDERPGVVDVVVVEDDVVIADVVSTALRQRGLEVRVIPDGAAAADALGGGTVRARLVLLDNGLPGLDGFGVLQVLRERGVLRSTKVVVLTARSTETETLRALGLGAVDHIAKPFSLPILVRRIRSVLAG
jgi:diguanylate cyclase (GGDEF)-like protein